MTCQCAGCLLRLVEKPTSKVGLQFTPAAQGHPPKLSGCSSLWVPKILGGLLVYPSPVWSCPGCRTSLSFMTEMLSREDDAFGQPSSADCQYWLHLPPLSSVCMIMRVIWLTPHATPWSHQRTKSSQPVLWTQPCRVHRRNLTHDLMPYFDFQGQTYIQL